MHIVNAFLRFTSLGYKNVRRFACGAPATVTNEASPLLVSFTSRNYEDFNHSMSAFQVCLYHGICYYTLAIVGYSLLVEHWSIIDSVYFATVVFTTIGYGDMSPATVHAKLFTMFMSLYGIVILGIFLGVAGELVVEMHNRAAEQGQARARAAVAMTKTTRNVNEEEGTGDEAEQSLLQDIRSIVLKELPIMLVLLLIGLGVGHVEDWSVIDSIWWLVVSGCTVGFGDYHPSHPATRVFCIFFLPLLVAVLGELLARIASAYMDRKQREKEKDFMSRSFVLSDLTVMDTNADGTVERSDFLAYMLVALQKVSKDDVDEILQLFDRLDIDGNEKLTKEDLVQRGWEQQAAIAARGSNSNPESSATPRESDTTNGVDSSPL